MLDFLNKLRYKIPNLSLCIDRIDRYILGDALVPISSDSGEDSSRHEIKKPGENRL